MGKRGTKEEGAMMLFNFGLRASAVWKDLGTLILEESVERNWENIVVKNLFATSSLSSAWPGNSLQECGHTRLNALTLIKNSPHWNTTAISRQKSVYTDEGNN